MKKIKTFEAFFIPKPLRKYHWKDEDIALDILSELKKILKSRDNDIIRKLEIDFRQLIGINTEYKFNFNDFQVEVKYLWMDGPVGGDYNGSLLVDGVSLDVSQEITYKIYSIVKKLTMVEQEDTENHIKKDFRINRKLI